MRLRLKYLKLPLATALFVATGGVWLLHSASAATGQIYLTPASPSVQNGSNVAFDLRVNPGVAINSVEATVHYDTSKLTYVSVDVTSSAFSYPLAQTVDTNAGTINLQRGTDFVSGVTVSSDARIAVITFKAVAGSGSSPLTACAGSR